MKRNHKDFNNNMNLAQNIIAELAALTHYSKVGRNMKSKDEFSSLLTKTLNEPILSYYTILRSF
jgi:hypothetical protein